MKTLYKVPYTVQHVELLKEDHIFEPGVVYVSLEYKTSIHSCLCGCGNEVVMPIDCITDGVDMGWTFTEKDGKASFTPSVGNYQFPCKSHYIMTDNIANFV